MIMGTKKVKAKNPTWEQIEIRVDGEVIKQVEHSKYLGKILKNNLKWQGHLMELKKKTILIQK